MGIDKMRFLGKMYAISDDGQVNAKNFDNSIEKLPLIDSCYSILREISEKMKVSIEMVPIDFQKIEGNQINIPFKVYGHSKTKNPLSTSNGQAVKGYDYSIQPSGDSDIYNINFFKNMAGQEDKVACMSVGA